MRFIVQVEGDSAKLCSTADEAIAYARTRVYLSPADEIHARNDLENGSIAEWSYGFKALQIIPRQDDGAELAGRAGGLRADGLGEGALAESDRSLVRDFLK